MIETRVGVYIFLVKLKYRKTGLPRGKNQRIPSISPDTKIQTRNCSRVNTCSSQQSCQDEKDTANKQNDLLPMSRMVHLCQEFEINCECICGSAV